MACHASRMPKSPETTVFPAHYRARVRFASGYKDLRFLACKRGICSAVPVITGAAKATAPKCRQLARRRHETRTAVQHLADFAPAHERVIGVEYVQVAIPRRADCCLYRGNSLPPASISLRIVDSLQRRFRPIRTSGGGTRPR